MTGFDKLGPDGAVILVATGQIPLEATGTDLNEPDPTAPPSDVDPEDGD